MNSPIRKMAPEEERAYRWGVEDFKDGSPNLANSVSGVECKEAYNSGYRNAPGEPGHG